MHGAFTLWMAFGGIPMRPWNTVERRTIGIGIQTQSSSHQHRGRLKTLEVILFRGNCRRTLCVGILWLGGLIWKLRCIFNGKILQDILKNIETSCSLLFLMELIDRISWFGYQTIHFQTTSRESLLVSWHHNGNLTANMADRNEWFRWNYLFKLPIRSMSWSIIISLLFSRR